MHLNLRRCDLFNKAFNHIAERIDEVYKNLTKGKAAPVGGVAYLSLEDSEVCILSLSNFQRLLTSVHSGTISERNQVSRDATDEAFQRHGPAFRRRKDDGGAGVAIRHPQLPAFSVFRLG